MDRQNEEGENHKRPGEEQAQDLHEVLEDRDPPHEVGNGFKQRAAGIEAGLRDAAGAQEIGGREAGAGGHQAEASKRLEDDAGEIVPVGDDVGEDADKQRLLHQTGDDIVVGAPRPEQGGERHVDDDQGGGNEGYFTAEQAKARIDVAGEDAEKVVNDAGAAHGSPPFAFGRSFRRG